ncbi:MAG: T9SS type A sorting domain-containing protein [Muribaculaceae bacterium]|nr:T9SS type A sorting domain-containing protein [Muribaculaceae bacterium]
MKKIFTLVFLVIGALAVNAQDVTFVKGDEVLENGATIQINAELKDLGEGFFTSKAETNGKDMPEAEQIYIKNIGSSDITVSGDATIVSQTAGLAVPTWCIADCIILPCSKTFSIAKGKKIELMLDQEFTNNDWSGAIEGTSVAKVVIGTKSIIVKFVYDKNGGGVDGVTSVDRINVTNNTLVYSFETSGNYEANIYSITGQKISKNSLSQQGTLDLSAMSKGVYVCAIAKNGKRIYTKTILVK